MALENGNLHNFLNGTVGSGEALVNHLSFAVQHPGVWRSVECLLKLLVKLSDIYLSYVS